MLLNIHTRRSLSSCNSHEAAALLQIRIGSLCLFNVRLGLGEDDLLNHPQSMLIGAAASLICALMGRAIVWRNYARLICGTACESFQHLCGGRNYFRRRF